MTIEKKTPHKYLRWVKLTYYPKVSYFRKLSNCYCELNYDHQDEKPKEEQRP